MKNIKIKILYGYFYFIALLLAYSISQSLTPLALYNTILSIDDIDRVIVGCIWLTYDCASIEVTFVKRLHIIAN